LALLLGRQLNALADEPEPTFRVVAVKA
jgi:hypothetical protein